MNNRRKNFWLSRLKDRLNFLEREFNNESESNSVADGTELLYNEITKENRRNEDIRFENLEALDTDTPSAEILSEVSDYFSELNSYYIKKYSEYNDEKDQRMVLVK